MSLNILVLLVLALAIFSERKEIKKQRGGADKAIVALLFVVVAGGGFAVAYSLSNDFQKMVNGFFGEDDSGGGGITCSSHKSSEECPSGSCEWVEGKCKDKTTNKQTSDIVTNGTYKDTPPVNNCKSPGPAYEIYSKLVKKREDCKKTDGDSYFKPDPKTSNYVNYSIECDDGINKIISSGFGNPIIVNSDNAPYFQNFKCKKKIKNSPSSVFNIKINGHYMHLNNACTIGGAQMNTNNVALTEKPPPTEKGDRPYWFFKLTSVFKKNQPYLLTNTFYRVQCLGKYLNILPSDLHYATGKWHHTMLEGTKSKETNSRYFYIKFLDKSHPKVVRPLYENEGYQISHKTSDIGTSNRGGDVTEGDLKIYTTIQGKGTSVGCEWNLVSTFDKPTKPPEYIAIDEVKIIPYFGQGWNRK